MLMEMVLLIQTFFFFFKINKKKEILNKLIENSDPRNESFYKNKEKESKEKKLKIKLASMKSIGIFKNQKINNKNLMVDMNEKIDEIESKLIYINKILDDVLNI
jgi:hypothetical protein